MKITKGKKLVHRLILTTLISLLLVAGSIEQQKLKTREQNLKSKIELLEAEIKNKNKDLETQKKELDKALQAKANKNATRAVYSSHKAINTTSVEQYRPLCEKYFKSDTKNCLLIMKYESGGNPTAYSRTHDAGLMQINVPTWSKFFGVTKEQLFDPETNVRLAAVIYDRADGKVGNGKGTFKAWTTYKLL